MMDLELQYTYAIIGCIILCTQFPSKALQDMDSESKFLKPLS